MEVIKNLETDVCTENTIIGKPELNNTTIQFKGKNNILYCDDNVRIVNSTINFNGDNCVVYLSANKHQYYVNINVWNDSVCYFGKNNYINGKLNIILSEQKHFMVGDDGLFSFDIWVRTADPHLIYNADTKTRINPSKSVLLGDHIWIGQHAMLLKGTYLGSGSVIAAMATISNKKAESNSVYGGGSC